MRLLSYFSPRAPLILVYMLQQVEYDAQKFIFWTVKFPNLFKVQKRQTLHRTIRAQSMLLIGYTAWSFTLTGGVVLWVVTGQLYFLLISILAPLTCMFTLYVSTGLLQKLVVNPSAQREIAHAKKKLAGMQATRIAVLGSYGKTSMKEMLKTVLSVQKTVAATPGNKNVLVSHARWVNSELKGDEDVLIFEYGEAEPGDIDRLAEFSQPDMAIITGLAPAHMDAYPTLEAVADDLAAVQENVARDNLFVNGASELLRAKIPGQYYDESGIGDMAITDVDISIEDTIFNLNYEGKKLSLKTGLLGRHQLGPLTATVAIALKLGLTTEQIKNGVSETKPFEHRMQPYRLGGAWIIDDSYNGNIEGVRAGLQLLKELTAKRKVYVTPGLVDQGAETESVHIKMGRLIADANPDKVILMQHSVTPYINQGLNEAGYKGEVKIETDPLGFYTNIDHIVAAGDLVMLQNDWPDSYN